ncbi:Gfo/Idh/MocA family protein [Sphingomonas sp. FW199]|uniref:Gfo/Idh/MocA family protein n=1 Tax=Sphingomonas sp. FW199 TaxID=3400217 RepID=UPI003CF01449
MVDARQPVGTAASPLRIGLVGIGKIARDQHLPSIADIPEISLLAAASRSMPAGDPLIRYPTLQAMLEGEPDLDAVSLCTPPQGRFDQAMLALAAGKHLMIEKPPGATVREVELLAEEADRRGVTLFATWHSREAAGVEPARAWLADKAVHSVSIRWKEDIRVWHPGQDWILQPGGLGVFDPGINALSILTRILPQPVRVEAARLDFPANRFAPIAARLALRSGDTPVDADFDFLQTGPQSWDMVVSTDAGDLTLSMGGSVLRVGDEAEQHAPDHEYRRLYRRFAELVHTGASDVDLSPIKLVADAFLLGERRSVEPFQF